MKVEVNALDSKGQTPLDLLISYPAVYPDRARTANFLRGHGATCSSTITSMTSSEIWARKKDAWMVVASLIATMAFQATLNPPGGVWQEDNTNTSVNSRPHIAGKSIMAFKNPSLYVLFITFASLAFMFSLMELLLNMSNTISNSGVVSEMLLVYAKYISTVSLVAAYWISVAFLTSLSGKDALGFGSLLCINGLGILIFLVFAYRRGFVGRPTALKSVIQFPPPKSNS